MKTKEKKTRKTVGEQYIEQCWKEPDTRDPIELQRAMQEQYVENLKDCVQKFRKQFPNQDFFVVVLTKQERLMDRMYRFYYLARHTCPTPEYDQAVYHYIAKDENILFVWCVPDQNTVFHITKGAPFDITDDNRDLVRMCWAFENGNLLSLAKRLNKED